MQKQPADLRLGYSVVHATGCCFASVSGKNTALKTVAILTDFPLLSTGAALHICLRFLDSLKLQRCQSWSNRMAITRSWLMVSRISSLAVRHPLVRRLEKWQDALRARMDQNRPNAPHATFGRPQYSEGRSVGSKEHDASALMSRYPRTSFSSLASMPACSFTWRIRKDASTCSFFA